MLRFLKRLLGLDYHPTSSRPAGVERRQKPRTSASSVISNPPAPATQKATAEPAEPGLSLQDSGISLEENQPEDRDPYDTGDFNRPDAWGRVEKRDDN
jgi:hypothetical protein